MELAKAVGASRGEEKAANEGGALEEAFDERLSAVEQKAEELEGQARTLGWYLRFDWVEDGRLGPLERQVQEVSSHLRGMQERVRAVQEKTASSEELKELKERVSQAEGSLERAEALSESLPQYPGDGDTLQWERCEGEVEGRIKRWEREVQSMLDTYFDCREGVAVLKERLNAVEKQVEGESRRLRSLEQRSSKEKEETLERRLREAEQAISGLERQQAEWEKHTSLALQKAHELEEAEGDSVGELRERLDRLERSHETAKQARGRLERRLESAERSLSGIKERVQAAHGLDKLWGRVSNLEDDLQNALRELHDARKASDDALSQVDSLREEVLPRLPRSGAHPPLSPS